MQNLGEGAPPEGEGKRWIGDNVLAHLETIDYLQASGQPGAMVFLDLAKAFDRIDRAWILLFFFFFFLGRSCLQRTAQGRNAFFFFFSRPQRKACKTSLRAPPPKERARKVGLGRSSTLKR